MPNIIIWGDPRQSLGVPCHWIESQANWTQTQRDRITSNHVPRCDLDLLFYKDIVGTYVEVKTRYCTAHHIRHKHLGRAAFVEDGQVPWTVKQDRVADGGYFFDLDG
jgi:hypothetical protein